MALLSHQTAQAAAPTASAQLPPGCPPHWVPTSPGPHPGPREGGAETHSAARGPPLSPPRPAHSPPGTGIVPRRPSVGGHGIGGVAFRRGERGGGEHLGTAGHRQGHLEQDPSNQEELRASTSQGPADSTRGASMAACQENPKRIQPPSPLELGVVTTHCSKGSYMLQKHDLDPPLPNCAR